MNSRIDMELISSPGTFNQRFEEIVQRFPDRIAFRLKTKDGYPATSYEEAYDRAISVASGLIAMGCRRGSRVAILSENRPEWVIAYLGIYFAGMVAVPIDTQISPDEWRRLIEDSEAQTVFASGHLLPKLEEEISRCQSPLQIVSFDPIEGERDARSELGSLIEWATGLSTVPELPKCEPSDVITIIYTSGTTGNPKGVVLTQSNIVSEIQSILATVQVDENDVLLCLLPLQHVLASVINVLLPLYLGAQVVFADTLKRTEILKALEEAGITILATVPQFFYLFHGRIQDELAKKAPPVRRLFRWMLRLNRFSIRMLKWNMGKILFAQIYKNFGGSLRLFVSGGSSLDPAVARDFHDMGFTILQGYGLTETTGACAVTRVENNVLSSVGPALPGVDIKIHKPDETGTGEILVRGPIVMKEYYRNSDATRDVILDGWFHTGDLGRLDENRNLFVTGRKKEVIVLPSGKNIYPDELEMHYLQSPCIQEIAIIGIWDEQHRGEKLHAVVVPNFEFLKSQKIANTKGILRDQIAGLSNQLPKYKRLMSYHIQSDALPRTTTRKIRRLELKEQFENKQCADSRKQGVPSTFPARNSALMESTVGRKVIRCLCDVYRRETTIDADMNLELDLGFDSMERVELLASLEQSLNLELPEDFGMEAFTVRELIEQLAAQVSSDRATGATRQSWKTILSEEALSRGEEICVPLSGRASSLIKYVCLRLIYYTIFRTLLRIRIDGLEHLPDKGPFIICPNHQSFIDPVVLISGFPYSVFRRLFFVGYSVFFSKGFMKLAAKLTNIVPVDPDVHLLRAMKTGACGLREGRVLCIFPEGGRSYDGELQSFKKGAAILSRELSVPIIPAAISGAHKVWPRDSMRIRPHRVTVRFGEPILPSQAAASDPYQADTEILRNTVAALLK